MGKLLIVDDEAKMRSILALAAKKNGHHTTEANCAETALPLLEKEKFDIVITDIRMNSMSGIELCKIIYQKYPTIQTITMTAFPDEKTDVIAHRYGVKEYLHKPFNIEDFLQKIQSLLQSNKSKPPQKDRDHVKSLVALGSKSPWMQQVVKQAQKVASRNTTVLLLGENGTGKEVFARLVHSESGRSSFKAINCGAIPEHLFESEFFGYEKGAFTGAENLHKGFIESAHNGTLFLDEIGEIPLHLQVKLLRFLQEREFTRVGGNDILTSNTRIIAATNKNLEQKVEDGTFREDLLYRLNVYPIELPPLRDRIEDIPALIDLFFIKFDHYYGIDPEAIDILQKYSWPGNIRELENIIERAIILADEDSISIEHIPPNIISVAQKSNHSFEKDISRICFDDHISLEDIKRSIIIQTLEKVNGNKSKAAQLLDISRFSLYAKLKNYNLSQYL